jgi:hypothetical protein
MRISPVQARATAQFPASAQGGGDCRTQLARQRGNGFFNIDVMAVYLLGPKQVRELLQNIRAGS